MEEKDRRIKVYENTYCDPNVHGKYVVIIDEYHQGNLIPHVFDMSNKPLHPQGVDQYAGVLGVDIFLDNILDTHKLICDILISLFGGIIRRFEQIDEDLRLYKD